ncbi:MAG: cellulase family glycosylhydrolase [Oscillospiraceae bacterium]|jgi:hypothetical protein|nr:cellulase family glycosylhydrolase [Oscillospiraceae bacterium]
MTAAVRACTQNGVIMMENSYYSNLGIPYSAEAPQTDGRREENVCFSPHAYDFMVDTDAYAYASNDRVGSIFEEHRRSQERLHSPVLVGEWGGGGEGESWFPHIEFLLNLFDSYAWSNTYYTYSEDFFDQPLMRVLSRPYPVAVNGTLQGFSYDRAAGRFAAGFIQSLQNDAAAESIFYLPRKAERISADPALQCAEEAIPGGEAWLLRCTGSPGEHRLEVAL